MNTIYKVFLTSVFAVFVVYSGVATASLIDTNGQIDGDSVACDSDFGSTGGTVRFYARYQANSYTCNPGTYLNATTATCVSCSANSYCSGGTFVFDGTNQGIMACDKSPYTNSIAGSWQTFQCYSETGTDDCSKLNTINYGTVRYANDSASYAVYKDARTEIQTIGACAVTSLDCDTGYTKTPASNGALVNYVHQTHNMSGTTTKYRALNGDNGENLNSTGLTNGQWQVGWADGTVVSGVASCNTTTVSSHEMSSLESMSTEEKYNIIWADGGIGSRSSNTFNSSITGSNCWCKMDSYILTGGNTQSVSSPTWKFVGEVGDNDNCAAYCPAACLEVIFGVPSAFFGSLGQQMACVANSVTCKEGEYLSGVLGQCVNCLADHYCAGGTFTLNGSDQGISSCPVETPYSNAGAESSKDCYVGYSCPAGQYLASDKTTCASCPAGSYCGGGVYQYSAIADQGLERCPLDKNDNPQFSPQGSTSSDACTTEITCPAGQYLAIGALICTPCPTGSYCPGAACSYSNSTACGIASCDGQYADSAIGAASPWACYTKSSTDYCSGLNSVPGTVNYASQDSVGYKDYYSSATETDNIGACAIISLTCPNEYTKSPLTNGALSNYTHQTHNISNANVKYRALNGDKGTNSESVTGLTNGQFVLQWSDGTKVMGRAFCSTTSNNSSQTLSTIDLDTTGSKCWCNMTGYQLNGQSAVSDIADTDWVYVNDLSSNCENYCSAYCVALAGANVNATIDGNVTQINDYSNGSLQSVFTEYLLGDYGKQMGCVPATYTCEPGYYLPMGTTQCALCLENYFCNGGTFEYSAIANGGINSCSSETNAKYEYSVAGARSIDFCYYLEEDDKCSAINQVSNTDSVNYANNTADKIVYAEGGSAVSQAGACAISSVTCSTGAAENPLTNGVLADSVLQSIPVTANTAIKYRAINGDSGENSNTNNQGAVTGLSNGEFEVDLGSAAIHGIASYKYSSGTYICQCSMNSYTLSGGSSVTVNPVKTTSSPNELETQADAERDCARICAQSIATDQSFRTELFAELGQQKGCTVSEYTCAPGTYLPTAATACVQCLAGSYCGGGVFNYNGSQAQGIEICPGGYTSVGGATAATQCFTTGSNQSQACSAVNPVSNESTIIYASNSNVDAAGYYGLMETENIGACAIISLECSAGYIKTPSTNGALSNYTHQTHNISKSNTKFRALNGNQGFNSNVPSFGDSTGMTNGTAVVQWNDGTKIYLRASCNNTSGSKVGEGAPNDAFTSSSTGANCWCNMTGYQLNGQSAVDTDDTDWIYTGASPSNNECVSTCSAFCAEYLFDGYAATLLTGLFGNYGVQMACGQPIFNCAPGEYLAMGATSCSQCPTGKYCPGGNYAYDTTRSQGINDCPNGYPNSQLGTYAESFCYNETTVNCSTVNSIKNATVRYANDTATQRTYYNDNNTFPTSIVPVGECAMSDPSCTVNGESLSGSAGPLANYETPMFGMPYMNNTDIYYRAINGDKGSNSGSDKRGDHTGMTNGTFRVVYGSELEINGTATCEGKGTCNCNLTSYKIGNGNTVYTGIEVFSTDESKDLDDCNDNCAGICSFRLAKNPSFGTLGDTRECKTTTYTCAPGEYLAANSTTCSQCPSGGYYCPGGSWPEANKDQGKETCPNGYTYSDAGAKSQDFCYKEPTSTQCSVINPVTGGTVVYSNESAATRTYYNGAIQTTDIGACAISSLTSCNTGYAEANATDGPLAPYVNQSRNLNLSSTKYKNFDGSSSGVGKFYTGDGSNMTAGTFEFVFSNGTKVIGRASCNTTNTEEDPKPYSAFSSTSSGSNCWCNMTGYQLNGQSAVNTTNSKWVPLYAVSTCATVCAQRCAEDVFSDQLFDKLFGSYGETAERCSQNSYNITWYDSNTTLTNNQCSYNDEFVLPTVATKTGYNFMGFEVVQ